MSPDDEQSALVDDRKPMVLVILDGLGDRELPELGGRTPAEAADTPNLDALAARGASGIHLPFGPGRAPASEISHWALLGYVSIGFPGRAVLEGRGFGHVLNPEVVYSYAALRTGQERAGRVWVTGRAAEGDYDDAAELFDALDGHTTSELVFRFRHLTRGEALLEISGDASPAFTDSDPFFEHIHPWLRPLPLAEAEDHNAAADTARALERFLVDSRRVLLGHAVNVRRVEVGLPSLDIVTTKWTGQPGLVPRFENRLGTRGAAVTSTPLYRGLAATLGMTAHHIDPIEHAGDDMARRLEAAASLIRDGAGFVHVHTKATDEAGHTKDPKAKLRVLEELDAAIPSLEEEPFRSSVIAITGDHATPSRDGVLHSGDPTPLVMAASTVRADHVTRFGEVHAAGGSLNRVLAADVLPLMLDFANRPMFLGTRITRHETFGLPDHPEPMRPNQ